MKTTKKLSDMLRKAAACSLACALVSTSASTQEPNSVASTSLCGDSYVLALVGDSAPDRVAALSWQSRDALSRASDQQRTLPQAWDNSEALLSLAADHIVFGPGEGYASEKFLAGQGRSHSRLTWGEDFQAVTDNLTMLAGAIGETGAARRIIAGITSKRRVMQQAGDKPKTLYLSRSGGSAGPGTYVDAAITAAGGENIMTEQGWLTPDTEFLISLKPDLIVTSFFKGGYESVNAAPLRHKAVRDFMSKYPSVDIPGSLWPCAGPDLIKAAELIHAKIEALP